MAEGGGSGGGGREEGRGSVALAVHAEEREEQVKANEES